MNKLRSLGSFIFIFLTTTITTTAQEWTQWRGPARDGSVSTKNIATPLWTGTNLIVSGREGDHASLLLTPQHVVFLTNGADLIVAKRATPAFTVERRYEVAEAATFAMPVLLGSNILVRDATGLMLLTAGK